MVDMIAYVFWSIACAWDAIYKVMPDIAKSENSMIAKYIVIKWRMFVAYSDQMENVCGPFWKDNEKREKQVADNAEHIASEGEIYCI